MFEEESKKLKESKFEDLPLLINDMVTRAAKNNYASKLAGSTDKIKYIPSSSDELNSYIKITEIDDSDIDNIANNLRRILRCEKYANEKPRRKSKNKKSKHRGTK